ncbi:hypothetical protein CKO27_14295 [Thiocystis violacea]|nr:hypothetical protein [Thiocystis violacea]
MHLPKPVPDFFRFLLAFLNLAILLEHQAARGTDFGRPGALVVLHGVVTFRADEFGFVLGNQFQRLTAEQGWLVVDLGAEMAENLEITLRLIAGNGLLEDHAGLGREQLPRLRGRPIGGDPLPDPVPAQRKTRRPGRNTGTPRDRIRAR